MAVTYLSLSADIPLNKMLLSQDQSNRCIILASTIIKLSLSVSKEDIIAD